MRTPRLPVVDWTEASADLNGLVPFAKRRNLVSARVPSHFKRTLLHFADQQRRLCLAVRTHAHISLCPKSRTNWRRNVVKFPTEAVRISWGTRSGVNWSHGEASNSARTVNKCTSVFCLRFMCLCLIKPMRMGNLEGGSYTGDFERWIKEGSGNGASLSVGAL